MKLFNAFLSLFVLILFTSFSASAQIETRLATNCATGQIEVPVIAKNFENIKAFQLRLLYDSTILELDTTYYHNINIERTNNEEYQINIKASNDTIYIDWSAYYGVNLADDLLFSLVFNEVGDGSVSFSWIEDQCKYTNIEDLTIPSDYLVDSELSIPFEPQVELSFEQFTIGCRDDSENGGCKAQAIVNISGGTAPYLYQWNDKFNQKDSIAIGLCEDPVSVIINDASGCFYGSIFDPVIYPAINPEDVVGFKILLFGKPIDEAPEIFITRPYVEFSVDPGGTIIEKYEWDFGDSTDKKFTQNVEHTFHAVTVYPVTLRTENIDGCDTTITENIEIQEVNFCIPNVFTPNGDGINDTWIFKLVSSSDNGSNSDMKTGLSDSDKCSGDDLVFQEHFKSTQLVVYNRNGNEVFECSNCTNNWDGGSLPDGVYFYVFKWEGEYSNGQEQGNVTILGSQN